MATVAPSEACTVQLSADLYKDVRAFISDSGRADTDAINRFVEAAVSNYLLRKATKQLHAATAHISEEDLSEMVEEALDWARSQK